MRCSAGTCPISVRSASRRSRLRWPTAISARREPAALGRMGAELLLDGGRVRLLDASGAEVWSYVSSPSAGAVAAPHRELMGEESLGPERSLPIYDQRTRVGTALARLPAPGLIP